MLLPSNILLYETDNKFHKRLAAHRLLFLDKIPLNFENYFTEVDLYVEQKYVLLQTPLSTSWLDRFASCENIVSRSQAHFYPPLLLRT